MQARRGAEGAPGGRRGGAPSVLSCRTEPVSSPGLSLATKQSPRAAPAAAQPRQRAPCCGGRGVEALSEFERPWPAPSSQTRVPGQQRRGRCAATLCAETSTQACTRAQPHGPMHAASTSAAPAAAASARRGIRHAPPPRGSAVAPLAATQGCQPGASSVATYGAGASRESSSSGSSGSGGTGPGAAALDAHTLDALQRLRSRRVSSDACPCSICNGSGTVPCKACGGTGRLGRGGYNKKNPVNMSRIIGSKWTAMQETLGWRHFRVVQQRKGSGGLVFVMVQASCDPSAQLWINAQILKDRSKWAAGWLQMSDIPGHPGLMQPAISERSGGGDGGGAGGRPCRTCSQSGSLPCGECGASGIAVIDI